jgi:hypothetical protein
VRDLVDCWPSLSRSLGRLGVDELEAGASLPLGLVEIVLLLSSGIEVGGGCVGATLYAWGGMEMGRVRWTVF